MRSEPVRVKLARHDDEAAFYRNVLSSSATIPVAICRPTPAGGPPLTLSRVSIGPRALRGPLSSTAAARGQIQRQECKLARHRSIFWTGRATRCTAAAYSVRLRVIRSLRSDLRRASDASDLDGYMRDLARSPPVWHSASGVGRRACERGQSTRQCRSTRMPPPSFRRRRSGRGPKTIR
jgi:hypothetical protein